MSPVDDTLAAAIAAALDQVGPRLKRLRTQRGHDPDRVSREATGISKSTLSRLETGGAAAHPGAAPRAVARLPGAAGRPRRRTRGGRPAHPPQARPSVKGRTVIPLTRQPDGMQAWKIVIPTSKVTPEPRAHDGHEWIYVLSGHMRLVLGDQDWVLGPGEVAEFDTQVPHWFGSTGDEPAEILSIFGRPGERMKLRTGPARPG